MHNNGFCHRDLKAENCVVDTASQCVKVSWISYSAWSALLCSLRISEASHEWLCHLAHNLCVTLLPWTHIIAFGCCYCRGNESLQLATNCWLLMLSYPACCCLLKSVPLLLCYLRFLACIMIWALVLIGHINLSNTSVVLQLVHSSADPPQPFCPLQCLASLKCAIQVIDFGLSKRLESAMTLG